jgi:hypothetical protein
VDLSGKRVCHSLDRYELISPVIYQTLALQNKYNMTKQHSTPYTYLIGWSKLDRWYYGVRFADGCNPEELWAKYKTSSKYVKQFAVEHGVPDVVEVRKTFADKKSAYLHEQAVLTRLRVITNPRWLNRNIGGTHSNPGNHSPRSDKQRSTASAVLSATMAKRTKGTFVGRKHSSITLEKMRSKEVVKCHCGTEGRGSVMRRWHFDNCRKVDV